MLLDLANEIVGCHRQSISVSILISWVVIEHALHFLASFPQVHYPETLAKALLYPIGGMFSMGWGVAKTFVEP